MSKARAGQKPQLINRECYQQKLPWNQPDLVFPSVLNKGDLKLCQTNLITALTAGAFTRAGCFAKHHPSETAVQQFLLGLIQNILSL